MVQSDASHLTYNCISPSQRQSGQLARCGTRRGHGGVDVSKDPELHLITGRGRLTRRVAGGALNVPSDALFRQTGDDPLDDPFKMAFV